MEVRSSFRPCSGGVVAGEVRQRAVPLSTATASDWPQGVRTPKRPPAAPFLHTLTFRRLLTHG